MGSTIKTAEQTESHFDQEGEGTKHSPGTLSGIGRARSRAFTLLFPIVPRILELPRPEHASFERLGGVTLSNSQIRWSRTGVKKRDGPEALLGGLGSLFLIDVRL